MRDAVRLGAPSLQARASALDTGPLGAPPQTDQPPAPSEDSLYVNVTAPADAQLFAAVLLIAVVAGATALLGPLAFVVIPLVAFLLIVIGALQLRNDDRLKDESFLKLMLTVVKRLRRGQSPGAGKT